MRKFFLTKNQKKEKPGRKQTNYFQAVVQRILAN